MEKEDYINWAWKSARVRGEKAALAWEIAERERKILKELDYENGYSLYVGIPFCPSVCSYCSFSSGPLDRWKEKVDAYVDALCKELEFIAERSKNKKSKYDLHRRRYADNADGRAAERLMAGSMRSFRENTCWNIQWKPEDRTALQKRS